MAEQRRYLVVGAYALLAAAVVWGLHPDGPGGLVIAPLLFCPGYAVVQSLDGRADRPLASAVLTVAVSFAVTALGGLVLQALGVGLTSRSWSGLMAVVTLAGLLVAATQRASVTSPAAGSPRTWTRSAAGTAALTCVVLAVAGAIAVRSERGLERTRSTTRLAVTTAGAQMRLSVVNAESSSARYELRIASAAAADDVWLRLAPGQSWTTSRTRPSGRVTVRLFRDGRPDRPYRTVRLGRATSADR